MMRSVLMFSGAVAIAGLVMAREADRITTAPPAYAAIAQVKSAPVGGRSFSVPRDRRGHFQTEARIDGQRIAVMVDTGASALALNESSAARVGVRPTPRDYTAQVTTANGAVKAARAQIPMVEVGGLVVRDVDALVLPDEALSENLLGLSFLSRLKRVEFAGGNLVLEQ